MENVDPEVLEEAREAMREVARELARFYVTTRLPVYEFDHAFRPELIAVLSDQLRREGVEPTVARLAALTGLPRTTVEQSIAQRVPSSETSRSEFSERGLVLGLETIVSMWTSDPRFNAVYGVPRDLPLRSTVGGGASLEDLASAALPGVSFEYVLQALKDHSLIETDAHGSSATLKSQMVFYRNLEAQVVSHYGRMVSGLMRNLRVNRERRLEESSDKPWNCALVMDRPVRESSLDNFLEIVAEAGDRWFRALEATEATYVSRPGEHGRRYAVCAFVAPESGVRISGSSVFMNGDPDARRLYQRALVTTHCISDRDAQQFRRQVAEGGAALLHAIDAEHKSLLALPGEKGTPLVVCCYMFDVTGSAQTAEDAIDLLDARGARHRGAA